MHINIFIFQCVFFKESIRAEGEPSGQSRPQGSRWLCCAVSKQGVGIWDSNILGHVNTRRQKFLERQLIQRNNNDIPAE